MYMFNYFKMLLFGSLKLAKKQSTVGIFPHYKKYQHSWEEQASSTKLSKNIQVFVFVLIFDGKSFHINLIETYNNLNRIIFENTKGQLVSKWFLVSSISSKKRTKEFDFTMIPQVDLFSFVFWRKSKTPKNHFEII